LTNTAFFIIFTGFSINLIVQFALGIRDSIGTKPYLWRYSLYQGFVLFLSVVITWIVFINIINPLGLGFLETLLLLPVSIFVASLLEKGMLFVLSRWIRPAQTSIFSAYNGLIFGANFFVLKIAESFSETLIMAAGFSFGYVLSMAVILEIRKRSAIEAIPDALRGTPLLLFSLGLLSLIFSAAAVFFFQMLNVY
jgi:Na+-translocating ferredoxin:NAD+ oxidoreductase RnfA subunit